MLTMRTDKEQYGPDETVRISMTLFNESDLPREYRFRSAQRFDVQAEAGGQVVWRWSDGMYFAQVLTTLIIQPHDSRVFAAEWNQHVRAGGHAAPGHYRLEAWIVGTEERAVKEIDLLEARPT
jgi:hypothetical protein